MDDTRKIYYERKAYRIVKKYVRQIVSKIPIENATALTANATVILNFDKSLVSDMLKEIYLKIGLMEGKKVTRELKMEKATSFFDLFNFDFEAWFLQNIGTKITLVSNTMIDEITKVMVGAYNDNVTVIEAQNRIYKLINSPNFYKWQALRIARTESTAASNYTTLKAAETANFEVWKEWSAQLDERTRNVEDTFDHYHMNGVKVGLYEPFNVNGNLIYYPGDPINGLPANIINCRCAINIVPKRDNNGRLIFRNNGI